MIHKRTHVIIQCDHLPTGRYAYCCCRCAQVAASDVLSSVSRFDCELIPKIN